ncbi:chalcone isomerase family protein [Acinetobacter sp. MB5]|uniref:chalcone isomerase family protein n=1 Tax=Acinetobacter sp. MB5 TaxID=2069438 RepID=UPI000DD08C7E|nr:chalcone isomerase family protein [Acinetobacter sp. MB5]
MATTIQKKLIQCCIGLICLYSPVLWANTLNKCSTAPMEVTGQTVGQASYFAQNCTQAWHSQSIRLDFIYFRSIPEWVLKRAANNLLSKNWAGYTDDSVLNKLTQMLRPVKAGDHYALLYSKNTQTLTLFFNEQVLGKLQNTQANQYFQIWFGPSPFSVKLKQQLLISR